MLAGAGETSASPTRIAYRDTTPTIRACSRTCPHRNQSSSAWNDVEFAALADLHGLDDDVRGRAHQEPPVGAHQLGKAIPAEPGDVAEIELDRLNPVGDEPHESVRPGGREADDHHPRQDAPPRVRGDPIDDATRNVHDTREARGVLAQVQQEIHPLALVLDLVAERIMKPEPPANALRPEVLSHPVGDRDQGRLPLEPLEVCVHALEAAPDLGHRGLVRQVDGAQDLAPLVFELGHGVAGAVVDDRVGVDEVPQRHEPVRDDGGVLQDHVPGIGDRTRQLGGLGVGVRKGECRPNRRERSRDVLCLDPDVAHQAVQPVDRRGARRRGPRSSVTVWAERSSRRPPRPSAAPTLGPDGDEVKPRCGPTAAVPYQARSQR